MSDSIISLNGDILAKNGRILKSLNGGGGGGSYSAGPGIDITSNTISTKIAENSLITTENFIGTPAVSRADHVKYIRQNDSLKHWGDTSSLVQDREYTVKLVAHHPGDYQQGDGFLLSKTSTTLTWNGMMMLMIGFKWNDTGYIDLSEGWDLEDGATESMLEEGLGNCQLQLTDTVNSDVFYTEGFYDSELSCYVESDGKLKVNIDKGQSDNQFLRWSPEQQKWYATDVSIPENIVIRDRMAASVMGHTADFTSNTITVNPASHEQHFASSMEIQNDDGTRTFKIHCSCVFGEELQATSNATTTGTIVFKNKYDAEWSYTLTVSARQTCSFDETNEQTVIKIVTDEYSLPFQATIGEPWAGDKYVDSVSFTFDGLQAGGTALSASNFGMGAIVNEWSFS